MTIVPDHLKQLDASHLTEVLPVPDFKLKEMNDWDNGYEYLTHKFQLDWNNHVNNIHYLTFMCDALYRSGISEKPRYAQLSFKKETGDTISFPSL